MPTPNQPNQQRVQLLATQRQTEAGYDFAILGKIWHTGMASAADKSDAATSATFAFE